MICPNCTGELEHFAEDTFYFYFRCRACQKERLIPKDRSLAEALIKRFEKERRALK